MSVLVVDYGVSNLGSICRALEECGAEVLVSAKPRDIQLATHLVLPGVGAFADGMECLERTGWADGLCHAVREDGVPLLGICLGMQLLANKGFEGGEVEGLGLVPGKVIRLHPDNISSRIPHIGWNEVYPQTATPLFDGIASGTDFYFVHSYHFIPDDLSTVAAMTPYCNGFVSAIVSGNVVGVQFHPEKSGRFGFQFLKNFLDR